MLHTIILGFILLFPCVVWWMFKQPYLDGFILRIETYIAPKACFYQPQQFLVFWLLGLVVYFITVYWAGFILSFLGVFSDSYKLTDTGDPNWIKNILGFLIEPSFLVCFVIVAGRFQDIALGRVKLRAFVLQSKIEHKTAREIIKASFLYTTLWVLFYTVILWLVYKWLY